MPFGYELKEGQLLIVEKEAQQVRTIFRRYLELGSVNRLVVDLRERNFRSKVRKLSTGGTRGGVAFTQGPLFYILRNRFYVGEVRYRNEICPGAQPPLNSHDVAPGMAVTFGELIDQLLDAHLRLGYDILLFALP